MHAMVMQDWTTIRGSSPITTVIQGEGQWIDMTSYQDAVMWLHVAEVTGSVTLFYETAPAADEVLFQPSVSGVALTPGVVVTPIFMLGATNPIARFLRWKLVGSGSIWDVTFRLFVAANPPTQ